MGGHHIILGFIRHGESLAFVLFETEKLLKGFKQLPSVKSILIEPSCYLVSTRVNKIKLYQDRFHLVCLL